MDDEGNGAEFPEGSFDVIIAADLWERLPRPERILRKLRAWLASGGRLITSFETVRTACCRGRTPHRTLVGGLCEAEAGRPIRFFTRREIEKLLYRTGFAAEVVEALPGPGHAEWVGRGRPGKIHVGELNFDGLSAGDAEEFYSPGFRTDAVPVGPPDFGLTSIIIVTFNQLEFTRQCVESIRRMTDEPYRAHLRGQCVERRDGRLLEFASRCDSHSQRGEPRLSRRGQPGDCGRDRQPDSPSEQ